MSLNRQPRWRRQAAASALAPKLVPINQMRAGRGPYDYVTRSVAAGVVVCAFDPRARVAGMLHFMLPTSSIDPTRSMGEPHVFGDTGIQAMVGTLESMGAARRRLICKVIGGAGAPGMPPAFQIGARNIETAVRVLKHLNIPIDAQAVGGMIPRRVTFSASDGSALVCATGRPDVTL